MSIESLFAELQSLGRKAFVPFITAGDPDLDFTVELIRELSHRGSSIIELGIPYSDPIADGPVIQASYTRALAKKIKLADIFRAVRDVVHEVGTPLVTMVSYAIVYRHGLERYIEEAQEAGFIGAIIPDLPADESEPLASLCRARDFSLIQLVTPTTPRERAIKIAQSSTGFLYYVSVTGITGERTELPPDLVENVAWLRGQTSLPICIGFGISSPEHVALLRDVADGLIVGSALVRRISGVSKKKRGQVLEEVGELAQSLADALNPNGKE